MNATGYSNAIGTGKSSGNIKISQQEQCARTTSDTPAPIPTSLVNLHERLSYLRTRLYQLSERLESVLAQTSVEGNSTTPTFHGTSPFCNTVGEVTFGLELLTAEVNRLHEQLEL